MSEHKNSILLDANRIAEHLRKSIPTNVRATTIITWAKKKQFPEAVELGSRFYWRSAEVDRWLEAKGLPLMPDPEIGG